MMANFVTPTEVTTSYRTGRRGDWSIIQDDETALLESGLSSVAYKRLKEMNDLEGQTQWDNGHEFDTNKTYIGDLSGCIRTVHANPTSSFTSERKNWFMGVLLPDANLPSSFGGTYPGGWETYTASKMDGAAAIRATIPTNPAAQLATATGEFLKEGLPSLVGSTFFKDTTLSAKNAGKEYLNFEFGWKPIVKDLKSLANAAANHAKLIKQLQRDSGRVVRRGFTFPIEQRTAVQYGSGSLYSGLMPDWMIRAFSKRGGPTTVTDTYTRQRWFRGAYTFYVNFSPEELNHAEEIEKKAQHLLGLELTPEVVWNLTPWSWLADWVGNVGDNLHNASRFSEDNLVLRYGYLMVHDNVERVRTLSGCLTHAGDYIGDLTLTSGRDHKQRIKATPYGFGLDTSGFSPKQWAILSALGLTKAPDRLG
jgi:hypothetical protein